MKIILLQNVPDNLDKPFGIYQYNEQLAKNPKYIDIRGIVEARARDWLDQVQRSHAQLSKTFLRYTRWWWIMPMSRLDARPWCQENLFKPLFFVRAVLEWLQSRQNVDEVLLIGCDPLVAVYLKEFERDLVISAQKGMPCSLSFVFKACQQLLLAVATVIRDGLHIARYHTFQKGNFISSQALVLYELFSNMPLTEGCKYYYNGLFNCLTTEKNKISYGCIDKSGYHVRKFRHKPERSIFFLLDNITFGGLVVSLLTNLHLILLTGFIAVGKIPCIFGSYTSAWFWRTCLFYELGRISCLKEICSYKALRTILKKHKYKFAIYPYEEKRIERAILFACQENNISTIGYTPHPQHHLALALRDAYKPFSPKPSGYAVCGRKYVDYFVSWCKKDPDSIHIWGSGKSFKGTFAIREISRNHLSILLLISHPNELKVFYSWLRAEQRISRNITYLLRRYKAVNYKSFSNELASLVKDFDCVKESHGDLAQDLSHCDLAVFCGTSAGPLAVNHGRLVIHIALDDFFHINPCFGDLDAMLSCASAVQFANRLDEICSMDCASITELYKKQRIFVKQIFSPIQTSLIKDMIQ